MWRVSFVRVVFYGVISFPTAQQGVIQVSLGLLVDSAKYERILKE